MKVAFITGASRGIGAATAKAFAQKGYAVVINYIKNEKRAREVLSEIQPLSPFSCTIQGNVALMEDCRRMKDETIRLLGKVDVLVCNAGVERVKPFLDITADDINHIIGTNLLGVIHTVHAFLPSLIEQNGSIVNVSSVWGISGGSCEVLYSASKAGVIGFTKALSKEVGSRVRVSVICPGAIDTEMSNEIATAEENQKLAAEIPQGRFGTAAEVAEGIVYLAEATYVNGSMLTLDGGWN